MKQSKTNEVLDMLKRGCYITSWDAIKMFKLTRLSAVIYNLKKRGYNIVTEMVEGDGCIYARYRLINEK